LEHQVGACGCISMEDPMTERSSHYTAEFLESLIFEIRGQHVILDDDLACIYSGLRRKNLTGIPILARFQSGESVDEVIQCSQPKKR